MPVVALFFSLAHVSYVKLHRTEVIRHRISVTFGMLCQATGPCCSAASATDLRQRFSLSGFFTLHSFLLLQAFPGASSSTSKIAWLHADY